MYIRDRKWGIFCNKNKNKIWVTNNGKIKTFKNNFIKNFYTKQFLQNLDFILFYFILFRYCFFQHTMFTIEKTQNKFGHTQTEYTIDNIKHKNIDLFITIILSIIQ